MPYIKPEERTRAALNPETPGELNFALTTLCLEYLDRLPNGVNYSDMADVVAALECAKQEFYRRVMAPYEDRMCATNGDVYPGWG